MLIQKRAKLKRTSMQQAWTEKISLAFRDKIFDFQRFQGAAGIVGPYISLLTDEQEHEHLTITAHKFFQARS